MANELVPEHVEVDPSSIAASFGTAQDLFIELTCLVDVTDLHSNVERREWHGHELLDEDANKSRWCRGTRSITQGASATSILFRHFGTWEVPRTA